LAYPHWLLAVEIEPRRIGPLATIVIFVLEVVFVLDIKRRDHASTTMPTENLL